jgi:hypothetical protein
MDGGLQYTYIGAVVAYLLTPQLPLKPITDAQFTGRRRPTYVQIKLNC